LGVTELLTLVAEEVVVPVVLHKETVALVAPA